MKRNLRILTGMLLLLSLLTGCVKLPAQTGGQKETEQTWTEEETQSAQPEVKDAANLLWRMKNAVSGRYATAYTNSVEIDLRAGTPGLSVKIGSSIDMQVQLCNDPFQMYVETASTAIVADSEMKEVSRVYAQLEEGAPVVYGHVESVDYWYRVAPDARPSELMKYYWMTGIPSGLGPDDLTLAPETQTVEGREAYVMTGTYTGEEMFYELYSTLTALLGQVSPEQMDLSGVTVQVSYYADAETFLPVQVEMEYEGMEELLSALINNSGNWYFGSSAQVSAEVETFRAVYTGLCFDTVEVTKVPEEGIGKAMGGSSL